MRATGQIRQRWMNLLLVLVCAGLPVFVALLLPASPRRHDITIVARQYRFEPERIEVQRGDEVRLRLGAVDTVHGFFLEGYGLEAEAQPGKLPFKVRRAGSGEVFRPVDEIVFTADRPGKFRYRCSVTCGTLHPFMLGELVVRPNLPYLAGIGGAVGVLLATLLTLRRSAYPPVLPGWRVDLLAGLPRLRWLITRPWFQLSFLLATLAVFMVLLTAGFFGSPIGNRNIIITLVWILWWFLLVTVLLPFGARVWCMMCPFPLFGEWFQRRRLLGPAGDPGAPAPRLHGAGYRWPAALANNWLQNILFLSLCTFSTILVTRPVTSAAVLTAIVVAATCVHLFFRKRSFCLYLCPIGGWMNVYSKAAMLEVRPRDPGRCRQCDRNSCTTGAGNGWGCPWDLVPGRLQHNDYCGMCCECIKTCANRNMTLRLRPFCSETAVKDFGQAWMIFIMLTLAILYNIIFSGPWGRIKDWANLSEVGNWQGFLLYAAVLWLTCLVVVPGLWYLAASSGRALAGAGASRRELFLRSSSLLIPLGLSFWIAFSLPLVMVNYSHILSSLSDPLGRGWDLWGSAELPWRPLLPEYLPLLQVPLVLAGLDISLRRGAAVVRSLIPEPSQALRAILPLALLATAASLAMIRLFAG